MRNVARGGALALGGAVAITGSLVVGSGGLVITTGCGFSFGGRLHPPMALTTEMTNAGFNRRGRIHRPLHQSNSAEPVVAAGRHAGLAGPGRAGRGSPHQRKGSRFLVARSAKELAETFG